MAKIISMQEMQQKKDPGITESRRQKVRLVVSREFAGHQSMGEVFSHLMERLAEERYAA